MLQSGEGLTEWDTAGRLYVRRSIEAAEQREVTVSRPQIKTLKASHYTRACRSPRVAGSPDVERVCTCWASWPMRVWAALPLLWGQPEPRQYAATTAPCQVEACLFCSREDGDLTERASHEERGESSCRKGRHAPQCWQGVEHGKRELRCLMAEVDPRLPPALKPGAPFCGLEPACEGFLGCGDGLLRAAVFGSAWEAKTA